MACNADEILKIQHWSTSFGTSMLNDEATMDAFSAFQPDAVMFDSMFPPGAYVSHILGVPLIAFSMVSIAPMNEVLFGIEEPADHVPSYQTGLPRAMDQEQIDLNTKVSAQFLLAIGSSTDSLNKQG